MRRSFWRGIGHTRKALFACCIGMALPAMAQQAPVDEASAHCSQCHGSDGIGRQPGLPHISAQPDYLLEEMLKAYQRGKRPTAIAAHRELAPGQIAALARYYAAQHPVRPAQAVQAEILARGESLYIERCADCHLEYGRASDQEAPLLAEQDIDYFLTQSRLFVDGTRHAPYLMRESYAGLSDADLRALAHFFAAQALNPAKPAHKRRR